MGTWAVQFVVLGAGLRAWGLWFIVQALNFIDRSSWVVVTSFSFRLQVAGCKNGKLYRALSIQTKILIPSFVYFS